MYSQYKNTNNTAHNNYIEIFFKYINPLSVSSTKWSNTLKQFVGNLATSCLSVFGHFVIGV